MTPPHGYTAPLSPDGRAEIVPAPPWHYVGDFTIVEYRSQPEAVAALLPPELDPNPDDPGAMAAIFADWQSCTDDVHEVHDPARYFSPDVVADFTSLTLDDLGDDRVRVGGVRAASPPSTDTYKGLVCTPAGYAGEARLAYSWPDA